jgi:hypothetical protein
VSGSGLPPKAKGYLEALIVGRQVPELVLKNDGHLLRIPLPQARGHLDPRLTGPEGEKEMMVAREPLLGDAIDQAADQTDQRTAQ